MILLGVDPGSLKTGWGVLDWRGAKVGSLGYGTLIARGDDPMPERLRTLHDGLTAVLRTHRPEAMAVESLFYAKNVKSALVLSQARGVLLLASAQAAVPVFEYAPLDIKRALVGYGRAEKKQVQFMVRRLLGLDEEPAPDAADALAVAFCHGTRSGREKLLATKSPG